MFLARKNSSFLALPMVLQTAEEQRRGEQEARAAAQRAAKERRRQQAEERAAAKAEAAAAAEQGAAAPARAGQAAESDEEGQQPAGGAEGDEAELDLLPEDVVAALAEQQPRWGALRAGGWWGLQRGLRGAEAGLGGR